MFSIDINGSVILESSDMIKHMYVSMAGAARSMTTLRFFTSTILPRAIKFAAFALYRPDATLSAPGRTNQRSPKALAT